MEENFDGQVRIWLDLEGNVHVMLWKALFNTLIRNIIRNDLNSKSIIIIYPDGSYKINPPLDSNLGKYLLKYEVLPDFFENLRKEIEFFVDDNEDVFKQLVDGNKPGNLDFLILERLKKEQIILNPKNIDKDIYNTIKESFIGRLCDRLEYDQDFRKS